MELLKNAIYNMIYQVFGILLPIITVPYISRVLGSEGIGIYSYSNSYVQYFMIIGMLGISLYGNRQVAYTKNNKESVSSEFWNIYSLQFFCTTISLVMYLIIFVLLNENNRMLYLAQSINLIAVMFDISWLFIGFEDMKSVVVRNFIAKLTGVILIFILVKSSNNLIEYTVIMALSTLVGQLIMWKNLLEKVVFVKPSFDKMLNHFLPACKLFLSQLAVQLYVLLDKTMLGIMTNESQVGYYENSQKTIKLALTVATSIGVVMIPRMAALYSEKDIRKLKDMIYKSFSFINLLAFPTFMGLIAITDGFTYWFYGDGFLGIENIIKVGAIIIISISWSNVLGMQVMIPLKRERQFTISIICGVIINVIINLLLINNLQSLGATISSVIAECSVTIIQFYFLRDLIKFKKVLQNSYKPIIGSILMYFVINIICMKLQVGILSTIIEVIIGGSIYILIMFMMKHELLLELMNKFSKRINLFNKKEII